MRNLLVLLYRYHALLLFVGLEAIALSLVFRYNSFQRATLAAQTQELVGGVQYTFHKVNKYFSLGRVNDSLSQEIARLKEMKLSKPTDLDTSAFTQVEQKFPTNYEFIPAQLIGNSVHLRNNYITLNVGTSEGVGPRMAVVNQNGIVGIVKASSEHFSSGISLLNNDFMVGARIGETDENGAIIWNGEDYRYAELANIPAHVEVKKGQEVEVNAYSFMFPEGTPIGVIESFTQKPGEAFYNIKVKLYNDLRNVKQVFVVKNHLMAEKENLEEEVRIE